MSLKMIHVVAQATQRLGAIWHCYENDHEAADKAYAENKAYGDEHGWYTARFDMLVPDHLTFWEIDHYVGAWHSIVWRDGAWQARLYDMGTPAPRDLTKHVYDDTEVRIGMRVRSHDFPGPRYARGACYTEGIVRAITPWQGCDRYEIEIERTCWAGIVSDPSDCDSQYIYPPVNGTPTTFDRITEGVVPQHLWMD